MLFSIAGCAEKQEPSDMEEPEYSNEETQSDARVQSKLRDDSDVQDEPTVSEEAKDGSEQLFDAMELKVEKGSMYIRLGDSFSYTREDGKAADYDITDNTLYIRQNDSHKTVLTLPKGEEYTSLTLNSGEGHVYVECELSLQILELDVSRGEVKISDVSVADSSTIEVEQGAAFVSGKLGDYVTAYSKEGELSLELADTYEDYNIELKLNNGSIRLGTENYHGRSESKSIDNGAEQYMELTCNKGDISVKFDK